MSYQVGKIIKLHSRDSPGTKKVSGLVKLDASKEVLEFTGILSLTTSDVNKTKIFGTILKGHDGDKRMIRAKRF